ncbi:MAG: hypothetical protein ACREP0_11075, partial [Rhodanobacteraceae bacterium]
MYLRQLAVLGMLSESKVDREKVFITPTSPACSSATTIPCWLTAAPPSPTPGDPRCLFPTWRGCPKVHSDPGFQPCATRRFAKIQICPLRVSNFWQSQTL